MRLKNGRERERERERYNLQCDIEYVKSTFMIFPKRVCLGLDVNLLVATENEAASCNPNVN